MSDSRKTFNIKQEKEKIDALFNPNQLIKVKKNDKYIMEYCSDERIIAKEYELMI